MSTARAQATAARSASRSLQALTDEERQQILIAIADALLSEEAAILEENKKDIEAAQKAEMEDTLRARLVLSSKKLHTLADGLKAIAKADEPIGKVLRKTELADGLVLTQETVPIGVLMIIFESRPDCLPQIAGLGIRSGNGLVLKGGKEAVHTNRFLHRLIVSTMHKASNNRVPEDLIALVETRDEVKGLLELDDVIDLIIPRGSGTLVKYIQQNTKIPVMGHSEGMCHVYVDDKADVQKAVKVAVDSKCDYPAACNAMETLLLHKALVAEEGECPAKTIITALQEAGVTCLGCPQAAAKFGLNPVESFKTEYGNLTLSVKIVNDMQEAVDHIHEYGSSHTECIVTEHTATATAFQHMVDGACVFHNASTRFADGYRFGLGAEVGISTGRIHARGPVGVEGLTTTKWKLTSNSSDAASEYSKGEKSFTHKNLPIA